jgi:IS4 transposase
MIDELPPKSIVLLDALYNNYEIISKCMRKDIGFVVQDKYGRDYKTVEVLGNGDEIVEIKAPKNRAKWLEVNEAPTRILLRRINCTSPDGSQYVLFTSVLDSNIDKNEIQLLYLTRWDVEISIREIKTIMDINVLRSKTPEMALKELIVTLATYNLIRKIIFASIKDLPFSPEEDFIQKFYSHIKNPLIDKKGRVYSRWSTGRKRTKPAIA